MTKYTKTPGQGFEIAGIKTRGVTVKGFYSCFGTLLNAIYTPSGIEVHTASPDWTAAVVAGESAK